jgi:hypothetical protein
MLENTHNAASEAATTTVVAMKIHDSAVRSPFDPANDDGYATWRQWKLDQYPSIKHDLCVPIKNPRAVTLMERSALLHRLRVANMVIYQCDAASGFCRQDLRSLAMQLGLNRLDGHLRADADRIATIQASDEAARQRYIPYTTKAINWHTDGYYNAPERTIRAFMLHCVRPAAQGGENTLLDPELVYIHLRDHCPNLLWRLFDPTVMSIPPNHENGRLIREQQSGPVFSIDAAGGSLHMRYTARQTHIAWGTENEAEAALNALRKAIDACEQYVTGCKLQSNQGIICNNVLHGRTAFKDDATGALNRLLYRARFYDRVIGTEICDFNHRLS